MPNCPLDSKIMGFLLWDLKNNVKSALKKSHNFRIIDLSCRIISLENAAEFPIFCRTLSEALHCLYGSFPFFLNVPLFCIQQTQKNWGKSRKTFFSNLHHICNLTLLSKEVPRSEPPMDLMKWTLWISRSALQILRQPYNLTERWLF